MMVIRTRKKRKLPNNLCGISYEDDDRRKFYKSHVWFVHLNAFLFHPKAFVDKRKHGRFIRLFCFLVRLCVWCPLILSYSNQRMQTWSFKQLDDLFTMFIVFMYLISISFFV